MLTTADYFSLFALGFLGTGHCIGMCGPLVIAFPARQGGISPHLLYHSGRITTYMIIGFLLGGLEAGVRKLAGSSNYLALLALGQVGFSLIAAAFLLLLGLMQLNIVSEPSWMLLATPIKIPGFSAALKAVQKNGGRWKMYLLGLLLGLLPCGLSYAAFTRALPIGRPIEGAMLLLTFGIGTVPGLIFTGTLASMLTGRYRMYSEILSGMIMIGMAMSLFADALQTLSGL